MFWSVVFSIGVGAFGYWMGFKEGKKDGFALGESIGYSKAKSKYDIPLRKSANHQVKPSVRAKSGPVDTVWMG